MKILLNKPLAPCLKTLSRYLERVNESGWYTNFGPLHDELTAKLEEFLGVQNLLLVANGTLALHVAYRALEIKSAICTPFSFAATASSLAWEKIPYTFSDIDSRTLNLSPSLAQAELRSDKSIDSIVATHVYGNPCDIESFDNLRSGRDLKVIYDASHAFGVKYKQSSILNFGDASTLSLHATKVFHTIEGGAIVFKERGAYEKAKQLINFGFDSSGNPIEAGINAKLNEYQAAVGLTLLEKIDHVIDLRRELFFTYWKALDSHVQLPDWNENSSFINGSYFPIILESEEKKIRVKMSLENVGVPSRDYFSPSLNTVFKREESCPISESISSRVLCLPLHYYLTSNEVQFIADNVLSSKL